MVARETWSDGCVVGLLLTIMTSLLPSIRGAPAYTTRLPRREPPCTHAAHATLCWTVQLKPPLHFHLPPTSAESPQGYAESLLHSDPTPSTVLHHKSLQADPTHSVPKGSNLSQEDEIQPASPGGGISPVQPSGSKSSRLASKTLQSVSNPVDILWMEKDISVKNISVTLSKLKSSTVARFMPTSKGESSKETLLRRNAYGDESLWHPSQKNTDAQIPHRQKMYVYHQMALLLAEEVGLSLLGKVGELYEHFVLCHGGDVKETRSRASSPEAFRESSKAFQLYQKAHADLRKSDTNAFNEIRKRAESALHQHHDVAWVSMETVHHRQKRSLVFNDPAFGHQWHLVNHVELGMDINITGVWEYGVTGKGVTVAVVDDGLEWNNPDLRNNYNFLGSWDLNDNDPDPMPNGAKISNHHGTRCAGEIAAVANNNVCGVGVAYDAKISGIRVLDGPMTDSLEAEAFNKKFDINAVYSCSWGPDDDGKTVDGPHILAAKAMKYGIEFGRHGYGSVFVVASGNGGSKQDNCNYDGYANSIYTVTIGAVDESGAMPFYAEECASMLGVTFSSGTASKRDIVTTDWRQKGSTGCTDQHTGTSASAPLAAGMIALMLEAQPCLTWRDVQYIIIITSVKIDKAQADWQTNGAGLKHSHKHGFGLISAWRMVNAARVWRSIPWMTSYSEEETGNWRIPHGSRDPLIVSHTVTSKDIAGYSLYMLEYVQVTVTITHPFRGKLDIRLICPSGTHSVIGASRPHDNSTEGFSDWTFTTVRCWGEAPTGEWRLTVKDLLPADSVLPTGHLSKWRLTLFGTPMSTSEFQERRLEVEKAMDGEYLTTNFTPQCDPPPVTSPPYIPLSEKTLKILFLASMFCIVFALYETMEYMLCYGEEKRQQAEQEQRAMARLQASSDATLSEMARLLNTENEENAEWLRHSQSAFAEEDEDDLFLRDAGIASQLCQARSIGRRNAPGDTSWERIPLSTFPTSHRQTSTNEALENNQSSPETQSARTGGRHSGAGASLTTPNLLTDLGLGASKSGQNQMEAATESHSGGNLANQKFAKNSILPEMWKALTLDQESDSDSQEDELLNREMGSSVSLLHNGVKKSYR